MTIRKILLATGAAALMSTPAWAHPGAEGGDHGNAGNAPGNSAGHADKGHGDRGRSHKCHAHNVGYVVSGTLVSQALTKEEATDTYSGKLEVKVLQANRHASGDKNATVTYEVSKAHLVFGMKDTNKDGSVGLDDLAAGDRVHAIGKITAVAPKCSGEFTATKTIRRIVFHAPSTASTTEKSDTEKS